MSSYDLKSARNKKGAKQSDAANSLSANSDSQSKKSPSKPKSDIQSDAKTIKPLIKQSRHSEKLKPINFSPSLAQPSNAGMTSSTSNDALNSSAKSFQASRGSIDTAHRGLVGHDSSPRLSHSTSSSSRDSASCSSSPSSSLKIGPSIDSAADKSTLSRVKDKCAIADGRRSRRSLRHSNEQEAEALSEAIRDTSKAPDQTRGTSQSSVSSHDSSRSRSHHRRSCRHRKHYGHSKRRRDTSSRGSDEKSSRSRTRSHSQSESRSNTHSHDYSSGSSISSSRSYRLARDRVLLLVQPLVLILALHTHVLGVTTPEAVMIPDIIIGNTGAIVATVIIVVIAMAVEDMEDIGEASLIHPRALPLLDLVVPFHQTLILLLRMILAAIRIPIVDLDLADLDRGPALERILVQAVVAVALIVIINHDHGVALHPFLIIVNSVLHGLDPVPRAGGALLVLRRAQSFLVQMEANLSNLLIRQPPVVLRP
ncbi:unnamed protein product [Protopolystoma xenopodis]|uniref:Uncharacterized protein n=1 Tax=Protopolystoma xenopodis TaxID=117903 RepID=A0A448WK82_9PLAT|nr:unnamed protein product [Protopolystoma xenopodis]